MKFTMNYEIFMLLTLWTIYDTLFMILTLWTMNLWYTRNLNYLFEPKECPKNCAGCKTSDENKSCSTRMVVYELVCLLCLATYLGQTFRAFFARIREHLYSVLSDDDDLTISTHFKEKHPDIPLNEQKFKSSMVIKYKDFRSLMFMESELISKHNPQMNVYSGKWKLIN